MSHSLGDRRSLVIPSGALLVVLLGAVVVPAVLSLAVGIVALALWREAFAIVFGVLVLSFAAMAITGGIVAIAFVRRGARLAALQTDFIANVSHEIRTPLAGIRLLAETLALGRADAPEQRKLVLQRLLAEERRLEALVDRILQWRRLEAGARQPQHPLKISTLVDDAVAPFSELGAGVLQVTIEASLPEIVGSQPALVGALRNLVDNALKFGGGRGPVEVVARRAGAEVLIEVRDHGPGIAGREHKRIFERFYRAPSPDERPGTGLGLAIARRVVEGHRGQLTVKSAPGQGSCFTIHLRARADLEPREQGARDGA